MLRVFPFSPLVAMEGETRGHLGSVGRFIVIHSNAGMTPLMRAQKVLLPHVQEFALPSWFHLALPAEMGDEPSNKRVWVEVDPNFFDLLPDEMLRIIVSFLPVKCGV